MKLLLTSAGVKNTSIRDALVDLLGKPIADSSALCIPTAMYGHPMVGPGVKAWQFISGNSENPMVDLGWKSVGVLELTALPSIDEERWVPLVRETDVLLVAGGDALYLCHWMRQSGLADLLPSLSETVWVGLSAGSMVMTPRIGEDFVQWRPPTGDDSTLGIVDFSICPHLAQDGMPGNSMAEAEQWAAGISGPAYAMDDETAIKVVEETKAYLKAGDRATAAKFALELQKAKDELAANEQQLQLHETAYGNNLKKIQHANEKLIELREKIQKYDAELKMSAAEAEIAKLAETLRHEPDDRLRPDRSGHPAEDRSEPRQGPRRGRPVAARASPRSRPKSACSP